MTYEEKKEKFYDKMREYTRQDLCIAFSGGVDSSLLLMAAKKMYGRGKEDLRRDF